MTLVFPMRQPTAMLQSGDGEDSAKRSAKIIGGNFMALDRVLTDDRTVDDVPTDYLTLSRAEALEHWLSDARRVALDIEWDEAGALACVTLAKAPGQAVFVPITPGLLDVLARVLPTKEVITWNGPDDMLLLRRHGVVFTPAHDGMMAAYVLQLPSQSLKANAREWCGMEMRSFKDVFPKDGFQPTEEGVHYACRDADATLRTTLRLIDELGPEEVQPVYDLGMRLFDLVVRMMEHGILVDRKALADLDAYLKGKVEAAERAFAEVGADASVVRSPAKLSKLLFETLRLPTQASRKGKSKAWSTDKNVLARLAGRHPVIAAIKDYRTYAKLYSTYVEKLPRFIGEDGRIHTTLKIMTVETGRPAAEEPNLLNLPNRTEEGRKVRDCYVAAPGYTLLSMDLSQIQLRGLADESGDPGLMAAFLQRVDVHKATAADMDENPLDEVSPERRQDAKAVNFGLSFGMTAPGLLQNLETNGADMTGKDLVWAEGFIDRFFSVRPGVQRYMRQKEHEAARDLCVRGPSGRRRWMFGMLADAAPGVVASTVREAINMPIQDSEAWVMWHWLLETDQAIRDEGLDAHIWLQVYDSMEIEVRTDQVERVKALAYEALGRVPQLSVPLEAEAKSGQRWGSLT